MATAITPLERVKVVFISNGEVKDMLLQRIAGSLWRVVNKDGSIPGNRSPDGHLASPKYPHRLTYVLYDAAREERATAIRRDIDRIQDELDAANRRLLDVYKEDGGRDMVMNSWRKA